MRKRTLKNWTSSGCCFDKNSQIVEEKCRHRKHAQPLVNIGARPLLAVTLLSLTMGSTCWANDAFVGYATSSVNQTTIKVETTGFSNKADLGKYEPTTIQPVGSVSKTLIGLSLMIAKEKGLIDLDKDINSYLDFEVANPRVNKHNVITLRHLATHTSGIVDNEKFYRQAYSEGTTSELSLEGYLKQYFVKGEDKYSRNNFHNSKPGTRYEYSNIGAALAAYVVQQATGVPFNAFTEQNIFIPLGMDDSGWFYSEIDPSRHATLYDEQGDTIEAYSLATYPDGAWKTTVRDLSVYLQELIKGYNHNSILLTAESWDELYRKSFTDENPVKNISSREPNSGIFMVYSKSGLIGHTGSDPGVSTILWFSPETNEGRIFMANGDITDENVDDFKVIWNDLSNTMYPGGRR